MVKEIVLTKDKVAIVDDDEFEELNKFSWYAYEMGKTYYATRAAYPRGQKGKKIMCSMHRAIMKPTGGFVVDHVNGDGLDNKKENLRLVSTRQNLQNRHSLESSKFPGVSYKKEKCGVKKWVSRITVRNKTHNIGYFEQELDAFTAYRVACKVITGIDVIANGELYE